MRAATRRWVGYALLALAAYLGAILVTLPASAMSWMLARLAPGAVTLEQPQGTVWSGSGLLRIASPAVAPTVRWEVLPSRLLRAALAIRLEADHDRAHLQGEVQRSLGTWSAHDLKATLPAESLPSFVPTTRLFGPQGNLQLTSDTLRWEPGSLRGAAEIIWDNAGTQMMNLEGLGRYHIALQGQGATLNIRATTESGDLEINAEGVWQPFGDGTLTLQGTAVARGRQQQLEPLLQMIGPVRPDGTRAFSLRAQLPVLPH